MYHHYNMSHDGYVRAFVPILYGHFYHINDPYFTRPQLCQVFLPPVEMIPINVPRPLSPPFAYPIFGVFYPVQVMHIPPNPACYMKNTNPSKSSGPKIETPEHHSIPASDPPSSPNISEKIMNPSGSVQKNVSLILKTMSRDNFQMQIEIIKNMITDEYLRWFAKHLVSHFAIEKYNFYALASDILDSMNKKKFNEFMLWETCRFIKVLLNNRRSEENKNKINNLGRLLGIITLSRNQPILFEALDLKSLLVNIKKEKTELDFIVPFVSKILESCANSKIFQPKCPWTKLMLARLIGIQKSSNLNETSLHALDYLFRMLQINKNEIKPIFK